jgi:hypothetical protein
MSRPLRIEYLGAYYHVMNRGLARGKVFLNDNYREGVLASNGYITRWTYPERGKVAKSRKQS